MKTVVTFRGGFKDGQTVGGADARRYLFLTDNGRVGARFRELPDEAEKRIDELMALKMTGQTSQTLQDALFAVWRHPKVQAVFTIMSKNPKALDPAHWRAFQEALQAAFREYGIDKGLAMSESQVRELAEQISRLSVCHIYEVVERVERGDERVIRLRYVGDDNTAKVQES